MKSSPHWPAVDDADRAWAQAVTAYRAGRKTAAAAARLALALHPAHFGGLHLLGVITAAEGQPEKASTLLLAAGRLHGGDEELTVNLGRLLSRLGRFAAAVECFRQTIALRPGDPALHVWLGLALLACGRFAAGWAEFEWRLRKPLPWMTAELSALPLWSGEPLGDRPLLLHHEQGMGDIIQFCRFLPLAASRGRVVLQVHGPLKSLLSGVAGAERVLAHDEPPPADALRLPMMSLGRIFNLTPASVPASPYLRADPVAVERWRRRLGVSESPRVGSRGSLRVGVVWAGNPEHPRDRQRSLPLSAMARLFDLPGFTWYSLQIGPRSADLAAGLPIEDLSPELGDFADTAAALMSLDLLISVDTSIVHLAGALGRPAWVMLSHVADWRWGQQGRATAWYPSLRLFRQPREGDWGSVIDNVEAELA